ncbi:MAG: dTMP kinase [Patescibacteria group bacterium]
MKERKDYSGYLISFEGPDGAGKITMAEYLERAIDDLYLPVLYLREPGGTRIGEKIRDILKDPENRDLTPRTEALLFQAARAQLSEQVIWPSLRAGRIVILDRFRDSSEAYQGVARGLGIDKINFLNDWSTGGLIPDLTFLLDLDESRGLERKINQREASRFEDMERVFHRQVREAYLELARADKEDRWFVVDASLPPEIVQGLIRKEAVRRLSAAGILEGVNPRKEARF